MCNDVIVKAVVKEPTADLIKRVQNRELGSDAAITADGHVIIPIRNNDGHYHVPTELLEENPIIMLGAFERGVKGSAPYISLVAGAGGEALTPHELLAHPMGSEWHGRGSFLEHEVHLVEWSRANRIDRFLIVRVRVALSEGGIMIEREILLDKSVGVADISSKPVMPSLTGDFAKWQAAASAIRKRWKCAEPYCAAHFAVAK